MSNLLAAFDALSTFDQLAVLACIAILGIGVICGVKLIREGVKQGQRERARYETHLSAEYRARSKGSAEPR